MRKLWISAVLLISLLNLFDAFFTIYAISKGAEEANPLMKLALENGFFLQLKILISIAICLCCLKINYLLVKIVIVINLLAYSIITVYNICLLKIL